VLAQLRSEVALSQRLAEARAEPASPERALTIALLAALAMRTQEAESALRSARDHEDAARLAAVSAFVALWAGDPMRALVAAEQAGDHPDARAVAAEALRLTGSVAAARERVEGLAAEHDFARLVAACCDVSSDPPAAIARLESFAPGGVLSAIARRVRARAWLQHDPPEPVRARDELSAGVWRLVRLGAPDELGRAYLLMAEVEAAVGEDESRAADWLARAHPLLTRTGTSFDQEHLRRAFRRYGRRAIDRVVDRGLEKQIEGMRSAGAHARDLSRAAEDAFAVGDQRGKIEQDLRDVLRELSERGEQLIAALENTLVDKERTGQLVDVVRALFLLPSCEALDHELPRVGIQLGGDSAALARALDDAYERVEVMSSEGPRPPNLDSITTAVTATLRENVARILGTPERTFGLVPIRVADADRVLVIRGIARSGRTGELERLNVLSSVAAAAYERARSAEALEEAAARDAATLEAIHEGIVTLDEERRVRAINGAGAALLGFARDDLAGRRLENVAGLEPLAEAARRHAADETVALPGVDVLVRARAYDGGTVLTLQELGRVRRLAHKLVGTSARFTFERMVGQEPAFLDTLADARRVAVTDVPILITGESGTGKELLAQAIHNASPRASHPFVGVNVAAIPRELLESELFGYEAGAFTGARAGGHAGRFELAGRGTILLDEIGDMPYDMQAKLLRVLQERQVQRLGGTKAVPVHARVIATTHQDLEQAVGKGAFRLDLFYRLRVVHLRLPPLRERPGDIRLLVEHHLAKHAERHGRAPLRMARHVVTQLERYPWPGNVRELANLVEGVASLTPPDAEEVTEVPRMIRRASSVPAGAPDAAPDPERVESLEDAERRAVARAFEAFEGNIAATAKALGIARGTLYKKLERYGLR